MDKRETYAAIIRQAVSASPYYVYGSKTRKSKQSLSVTM